MGLILQHIAQKLCMNSAVWELQLLVLKGTHTVNITYSFNEIKHMNIFAHDTQSVKVQF